jgi:sterol desaturase/sphingolipid hydroxylase (fatty acid hydroxylase superfamily)
MFNHGNIRLPLKIDRILRYFIVTPDMHRVHHSVIIRETNSNYGFNLPWWDRLFGTYCHQPAKGHEEMTIGLTQFRDSAKLTLPWLLILPFIGNPGRYPINRH